MRITLNTRSIDELMKVMSHYDISNPTHMVQIMITQLNNSIPLVEDKKDESTKINRGNA